MTYEQCSEELQPEDAVIVHIHKDGARFLADVHRRLTVIGGSVSLEDHEGPMPVPDALKKADAILEVMKPYGFTRVGVVLYQSMAWNPVWGKLKAL